MSDWIITIPRAIPWDRYQRELNAVSDGKYVLNYRTSRCPAGMGPGDRCFIVHDGRVRGWSEVVGIVNRSESWKCATTDDIWPAGTYIQRSGPFHPVDGPPMTGFRGVRRYEP